MEFSKDELHLVENFVRSTTPDHHEYAKTLFELKQNPRAMREVLDLLHQAKIIIHQILDKNPR